MTTTLVPCLVIETLTFPRVHTNMTENDVVCNGSALAFLI